MILIDNKIGMEDLRKFVRWNSSNGFFLPKSNEENIALSKIKRFCIQKFDSHHPRFNGEERNLDGSMSKEFMTDEKTEILNDWMAENIAFCLRLGVHNQITAMLYLPIKFAKAQVHRRGWKVFQAALPIAKQYEVLKDEVLF